MAYLTCFTRQGRPECDDAAARAQDLKTADEWVDKTMTTKRLASTGLLIRHYHAKQVVSIFANEPLPAEGALVCVQSSIVGLRRKRGDTPHHVQEDSYHVAGDCSTGDVPAANGNSFGCGVLGRGPGSSARLKADVIHRSGCRG